MNSPSRTRRAADASLFGGWYNSLRSRTRRAVDAAFCGIFCNSLLQAPSVDVGPKIQFEREDDSLPTNTSHSEADDDPRTRRASDASLFGDWYNSLLQAPCIDVGSKIQFEREDDPLPTDTSNSEADALPIDKSHCETDTLSINESYSETDDDPPATVPSPSDISLSQLELDPISPTFTPFPLLPQELRLKIWQLAHPHPRNVILSFPQNPRTRARTRDWDNQWIFPARPISQFAHLLVNHEARDFFLFHYQVIFADFPSNDEKKRKGAEGGWYFNSRKDSLCFGDGVRGLRWFMGRFPEEDVWGSLKYIDVDIDLRAFHREGGVEGYMAWEERSALCLAKMKKLKLVSMRVVVVREQQWKSRGIGYWRPWENSGRILKDWLMGTVEEGRSIDLAMQYIWTEMGGHASSIVGNKEFLKRYPGVLSEDIRRRWMEMGIFLQDWGNKKQTVYNTEREIFCRNLAIRLH